MGSSDKSILLWPGTLITYHHLAIATLSPNNTSLCAAPESMHETSHHGGVPQLRKLSFHKSTLFDSIPIKLCQGARHPDFEVVPPSLLLVLPPANNPTSLSFPDPAIGCSMKPTENNRNVIQLKLFIYFFQIHWTHNPTSYVSGLIFVETICFKSARTGRCKRACLSGGASNR